MSFHDLHHQGVPFVLPNAWDVPSALAYLAEGFTAIGTTSFGVSSSGGHPDGHRATRGANIALAAALAPLQCYVSVDIEDGYSDEPDAIADYVAQLSTAGINIEDSSAEKLIDPALAAAKIVAIKQRNPEVFVNARVDTYWLRQHADTTSTIQRALRYVDAGADGVADLGELGVARVSTGSVPYSAGLYAAAHAARAVSDGEQLPRSVPYAELQARLVDYENRTSTT